MSRSQRLTDFETRSVRLIAACALGLAGMASAQFAPSARQGSPSATPASLSRQTAAPRPAQWIPDRLTARSDAKR